jgi:hypothetical protein
MLLEEGFRKSSYSAAFSHKLSLPNSTTPELLPLKSLSGENAD